MTKETLRSYLEAAPFTPFTIHLADGKAFMIDHPDFTHLMRDDYTLFINTEGGRFALVSLPMITRVEGIATEVAS